MKKIILFGALLGVCGVLLATKLPAYPYLNPHYL